MKGFTLSVRLPSGSKHGVYIMNSTTAESVHEALRKIRGEYVVSFTAGGQSLLCGDIISAAKEYRAGSELDLPPRPMKFTDAEEEQLFMMLRYFKSTSCLTERSRQLDCSYPRYILRYTFTALSERYFSSFSCLSAV